MAQATNTNSFATFLRKDVSTSTLLIMVAAVPALSLVAYRLGGETALILVALALPLLASLKLILPGRKQNLDELRMGNAHLLAPAAFDAMSQIHLDDAREDGRKSAVFMIEMDDFEEVRDRHGQRAMEDVLQQVGARLRTASRTDDEIANLEDSIFGICLRPQPQLDLETCLELSGRIGRSLAEPYAVDGTSIYMTASIGFCQLGRESSAEREVGKDPVLSCARDALQVAKSAAPGAIRAFSADTRARATASITAITDAETALEDGAIVSWFQPQISTDTGRITGFETLARWMHPTRGALAPAEFLPQLEKAQRMNRLSEVMLFNAFSAMRAWDEAGLDIQHVGVNFSSDELSDPALAEKLAWELDRFELAPSRLAVEILETVVARGPDDVVTRNIKALSAMGCRIDLDDFGTGHASLASIRRFGVSRIKIDRSFVMKSDRDPEQQRMIRAILTMAEKLEIETIAEGVETVGEHSLLAQLGCAHVQGYGIAKPMPFEQTLKWVAEHNAKLQSPPDIGRATG